MRLHDEVGRLLTPDMPSATFTVDLVAPGHGKHVGSSKRDIDVSSFQSGGTIQLTGVVGANGYVGSFDLFPANVSYPTSMLFHSGVGHDVNVPGACRGTLRMSSPRRPSFTSAPGALDEPSRPDEHLERGGCRHADVKTLMCAASG